MTDLRHDGKLPGGYSVEQAAREMDARFLDLLIKAVN